MGTVTLPRTANLRFDPVRERKITTPHLRSTEPRQGRKSIIPLRKEETIFEYHILSMLREWNHSLPEMQVKLMENVRNDPDEYRRALGVMRSLHDELHQAHNALSSLRALSGVQWRLKKRALETHVSHLRMLLQYCHTRSAATSSRPVKGLRSSPTGTR